MKINLEQKILKKLDDIENLLKEIKENMLTKDDVKAINSFRRL